MADQVIISDHAVLRYIERVYKLNLEPVRQEIARLVTPAAKTGAASITIDGATYHLARERANTITVTTVTPKARTKRGRYYEGLRKHD